MIARLSGSVLEKEKEALIIDVHGIGYRVRTTPETIGASQEGSEISLYTHLAVREDSQELFGFRTKNEVEFFEMLMGVSGVGPRSALAVLKQGDVKSLKSATAAGDISYLTNVSGIGKKKAEKIIVELRDKLALDSSWQTHQGEADLLEALKALGYSAMEAREALKQTPKEIESSEERLKFALKSLGKHG